MIFNYLWYSMCVKKLTSFIMGGKMPKLLLMKNLFVNI